jgi:hypothetical protein
MTTSAGVAVALRLLYGARSAQNGTSDIKCTVRPNSGGTKGSEDLLCKAELGGRTVLK